MKIRLVRQNEYRALIDLMDESFDFKKKEEQFKSILPKLYYPSNTKNTHLGVYDNDKLVASLGLYPMTLYSSYGELKAVFIGGVSTHPKYRNKGYFTSLMNKAISLAKANKYDVILLGGNRVRYNRFGFECVGLSFSFSLTKKNIDKLNAKDFKIKQMKSFDTKDIRECLSIYLNKAQHINRTIDDFYLTISSWRAKPYVVYSKNKVVGYFAVKGDEDVIEYAFKKGYRDTVLKAILSKVEHPNVFGSIDEYNNDTLNKCEFYHSGIAGMAYVINYKNVCKYVGITSSQFNKIASLERKELARKLFGDGVSPSIGKISLYISYSDHC